MEEVKDLPKSQLWTKEFINIFIVNFFVALIFYLLMTTLSVYAVNQFHASQSEAGLAASMFVIGALFARLFAGKYIEVIGRKKLLNGSMFLFVLSTLLYFPVENLHLLLVIRFLHGAAFGAATTCMSAVIMDMIPNERKGEGTGYFSLSSTSATAIGPFLGIFITQHFDYDMIFVACTVFSVICLIIILLTKIPSVTLSTEQLQTMKTGFKLQDFFEKGALPISIYMFLMAITYSSIVSFINSYAIEIGLTKAASLFFMVYGLFLFVSRPTAGKLLDQKGDNIVIYPGIILFSISLLLLSLAEHGLVLLLSGALLALGFGTIMSSAQMIAIKEAPKHKVGLATSSFFIFMDGGMGLGPYLIGTVIPYIGFRGMYLSLSLIVLLSVILYYFLHGIKATSRKQQQQLSQSI